MVKKTRFPKIFFGWWTVIATGIISFLGSGFVNYGFSVLFKPLSSELGLSRALTSTAVSVRTLGQGIEAPLAGWGSDRYGPRLIILFGILCLSLGFIMMYFVDSLWSLLLVWGLVIGSGWSFGCMIPTDKAIVNMFVKKRGIALSVKFAMQSLSGFLMLPIIAWLVINQGWRTTCIISGIVFALVSFPLAWFLIKQHRAEYYGLIPDGATEKINLRDANQILDQKADDPDEFKEVEFTLKQTMKTPTYWMIIAVGFVSVLVMQIMNIHSIPFLTDRGYDPVVAAAMMSIMITSSIPSRIVTGFMADRVKINQMRFILVVGYLLEAIGVAAFLFNESTAMIFVWFLLAGLGQGASGGVLFPMIARYYGRKAYGTIDGSRHLMNTPIGLIAPVYSGWVYDTTGSYITVFKLFALMLVLATIVAIFLLPPKLPTKVTDI